MEDLFTCVINCNSYYVEYCTLNNDLLTPTDKRYNDDEYCSSFLEHKYQFLKEEDSFSSHPHPGHQDEVMEEHTHSDTASCVLCPVNTSHKHHQEQYHGQRQLYMKLGHIFRTEFSGKRTKYLFQAEYMYIFLYIHCIDFTFQLT